MQPTTPAGPDLSDIKSLIGRGEFGPARQRAEALLAAHPHEPQLHNMLGIVALQMGEAGPAETRFREALRLDPAYTGAASNLGISLMRQRKFDPAIEVLEAALRHDPASLQARANLANACLGARQYRRAFDESTRLLDLAPGHPEFLKLRAVAALEIGEYDALHAALDAIEAAGGASDWTARTRFDALAGAGETVNAVAYAERNAAAHPALLTPLAQLLIELGRFEEARTHLKEAIRRDPDDATAYFHYGNTRRWTSDDPVLDQLKAAAANYSRSREPRGSSAFFALAKAGMDLGEHRAVFPALHIANDLQRGSFGYDLERQKRQAQDIRDTWTAAAIAALDGCGVEDVAPIFIVGVPRSGSTLTEHIIEAHPDVTSVGEASFTAPFFPTRMSADPATVRTAAQAAAEEVRRLAGPKGRLLDKYLYNYQRIGSLAAAFPRARFIQTWRDPRAIALSIYSNPLKIELHPYSADLTHLAQFFVEYCRLMDHWKAVLGDRVVISNYQEMVEDPEPAIRALIARLDLPWDDACLRPEAVQKRVRTLSVVQVRSGIHSGSVERWRPYEADLAPFIETVSSVWNFDKE